MPKALVIVESPAKAKTINKYLGKEYVVKASLGHIGAFERAGVDAVVVNVAGCGSAMKEYAELLAGDGEWAERAAAFSAKVRDLTEFLAELGPVAQRHPLPVTVAYHDACHLAHAQGITQQPRDLLPPL